MNASAALCFGPDHLYTLEVYNASNAVPNAIVTFYRNTDRTFKADNKTVTGTEDAEATTGSSGSVTMNLDEATYYVTVIAAGYQKLEVDVSVPEDGVCGNRRVFVTPEGEAAVDPSTSKATIDRTTIFSDEKSTAVLTITARNRHESVLPNVNADLTGNLPGLRIEKPHTKTDATGQIKFYIQSTTPGSAFLYPRIGTYSLPPIKLTVLYGDDEAPTISVSKNRSSVVLSGTGVSDGLTPLGITVTVRDQNGNPLSNINTSVRVSERGVRLEPETAQTDASGAARFNLTSASITTGFLTVLAGGQVLDARPAFSFLPAFTPGTPGTPTAPAPREPYRPDETIPSGVLVKLPDDGNPETQHDTTVYFVASNGARHPFTHARIYFTWFKNFDNIHLATPEALARLPLGRPVPFKAGTRLMKFDSDPKVYALSSGRAIRWLKDEAVAEAVYGSAWSTLVEEFPAAEFALYSIGSPIERAGDYKPTEEAAFAASLDLALRLN